MIPSLRAQKEAGTSNLRRIFSEQSLNPKKNTKVCPLQLNIYCIGNCTVPKKPKGPFGLQNALFLLKIKWRHLGWKTLGKKL